MDPVNSPIEPIYQVPQQQQRFSDLMKNKWFLIIAAICVIVGVLLIVIVQVNPQRNTTATTQALPTEVPQPTVFSLKEKSSELNGQAAVDADFAEWEKENLTTYPWLQKLPIRIPNAFVYFDINRKKFIGLLYTREQKQVDELKLTMMGMLRDRNIETKEYIFEWIVVP